MYEKGIFQSAIDLIANNIPEIIKYLLSFLYTVFESLKCYINLFIYFIFQARKIIFNIFSKEDLKQKILTEFGQIFYIGKLFFIFENYEEAYKIQCVNILSKIIENTLITENFRRIKGLVFLIEEFKKSKKINLRISILNCMNKILLNHDNIQDFKIFGVIPVLENALKNSKFYMEVVLILNIFTTLIMDDDLSVKILDNCLKTIINLLLMTHSLSNEKMSYEDIKIENENDAKNDLEIHCFRLLRFLFSIEKNKKVKKINIAIYFFFLIYIKTNKIYFLIKKVG